MNVGKNIGFKKKSLFRKLYMKNSVFAWKTNVLQKIVHDNTAYLKKYSSIKKFRSGSKRE